MIEMAEMAETLSFKMSKDFHDHFSMIVGKLDDTDKSKVLRACVVYALPFLVGNPEFINSLAQRHPDSQGYLMDILRKPRR